MTQKSPIISPKNILDEFGAVWNVDDSIFTFKNWKIYCSHGSILNSTERASLAQDIEKLLNLSCSNELDDHIKFNDLTLSLPLMIFGHDGLRLEYQNFNISMDSKSAITSWVKQQITGTYEQLNNIIEVPCASDWEKQQKEAESTMKINRFKPWDWTYTTTYCGNIGSHAITAESLTDIACISDFNGINMEVLTDKSQPILFFDEYILYQDELEDFGEVSISVKVRVMPTCWFILIRFFLRVDSIIIKIRECRYYHEFGSAVIYGSLQWKEVSLKVSDVSISSITRRLVSDKAIQLDSNVLSQIIPSCNEKYNVPLNFQINVTSI